MLNYLHKEMFHLESWGRPGCEHIVRLRMQGEVPLIVMPQRYVGHLTALVFSDFWLTPHGKTPRRLFQVSFHFHLPLAEAVKKKTLVLLSKQKTCTVHKYSKSSFEAVDGCGTFPWPRHLPILEMCDRRIRLARWFH